MTLVHIRLPDDILSMIEDTIEGTNTTEKVRNYICSSIIGREMLEYEKAKSLAKIEYIDKALKNNPFYSLDAFSQKEKEFLMETIEALSRKPEFGKSPAFFNARKKTYNEQFGKYLTGKEFELLVYRYKESLKK